MMAEATKQFNLRRLFLLTTTIAVAALMLSPQHDYPSLRQVGLGICLYWVAFSLLPLSKNKNPFLRWPLLLSGLLCFVVSMVFTVRGIAFFVGPLFLGEPRVFTR